jgi:hypothetical protein
MYLNLSQVKYRVTKLAAIIEAPRNTLPTFGHSEQSGRPHVEVDTNGYHYVVAERGQEFQRHTTSDLDELFYDVFQSVTFELACKYELANRISDKDSRRILFAHQEELLSQLHQAWGERRKQEHKQILERHPFDDYASVRATFSKELREQGNSSEVAWKIACEKYPLPKESEK